MDKDFTIAGLIVDLVHSDDFKTSQVLLDELFEESKLLVFINQVHLAYADPYPAAPLIQHLIEACYPGHPYIFEIPGQFSIKADLEKTKVPGLVTTGTNSHTWENIEI